MSSVIAFNVLAVIFLPILVALFAPQHNRSFAYVWALMFCLCLSFWGWVIFVAVHFASKYW
jgi:lipopolysaccharide export LptBFGC system permease protein LptF